MGGPHPSPDTGTPWESDLILRSSLEGGETRAGTSLPGMQMKRPPKHPPAAGGGSPTRHHSDTLPLAEGVSPRTQTLQGPRLCLFTQLWAKVGPDLLASSPCCRQPGMHSDGGYSRAAVDGSQGRRDRCPHKMGKGEISVGPRGGVDFQSKLSFENGARQGGERRERCDVRSVSLG